jgi:hypothetical protein
METCIVLQAKAILDCDEYSLNCMIKRVVSFMVVQNVFFRMDVCNVIYDTMLTYWY